jgi:hypothetical protein
MVLSRKFVDKITAHCTASRKRFTYFALRKIVDISGFEELNVFSRVLEASLTCMSFLKAGLVDLHWFQCRSRSKSSILGHVRIRIRSGVLITKKYTGTFNSKVLFFSKIANYLSLGLHEGLQAPDLTHHFDPDPDPTFQFDADT